MEIAVAKMPGNRGGEFVFADNLAKFREEFRKIFWLYGQVINKR